MTCDRFTSNGEELIYVRQRTSLFTKVFAKVASFVWIRPNCLYYEHRRGWPYSGYQILSK